MALASYRAKCDQNKSADVSRRHFPCPCPRMGYAKPKGSNFFIFIFFLFSSTSPDECAAEPARRHCLLRGWAACTGPNKWEKNLLGWRWAYTTAGTPHEAGREAGAGRAAGSFGSPEEHCTLSAMGGAHPGCPCGQDRTRCAFSSLVLEDPRVKLAAFPRGNTSSPARCGREESGCNSCLNKGCLYQRHPIPTAGQHLMFPFQSPHTVCEAFGNC